MAHDHERVLRVLADERPHEQVLGLLVGGGDDDHVVGGRAQPEG